MCQTIQNPATQLSLCTLTLDPWEQPSRKWIVLKGIDWFVVYRWLFISFHTAGLTFGDPSVDQSTESHDLHPFATALISFDRPQVGVPVVNPVGALIGERGRVTTQLHVTIFSRQMSNTLNLMYQQILLNYLYVVDRRARVCASKWCSYVGVYSSVWRHSCMLVFTRKWRRDIGERHFHLQWGFSFCNTLLSHEESLW